MKRSLDNQIMYAKHRNVIDISYESQKTSLHSRHNLARRMESQYAIVDVAVVHVLYSYLRERYDDFVVHKVLDLMITISSHGDMIGF